MIRNTSLQSYRRIFSVALPMILSAISVPMLGIVDTAILGHLDSTIYLAAINVATTIFNVLFWGFGFLKMSTTGLIAQAYGQGDESLIKEQLSQAIVVAFCIAVLLLLFQHPIAIFALSLTSQGGAISDMAAGYFDIRIMAAPATLMIYVFYGYFLAVQKAKLVLWMMLISQVGNMIMDYLFVMHFHWGINGVAYGSLISEYMALIFAIIYLINSGIRLALWHQLKVSFQFNSQMRRFFSLNRDIFIRTLCLMAVFTMMTKGSAKLGERVLAANAVLLNFFYIMSYGLDGFAHAVESLCGQAYGANDVKKLKKILTDVFRISFAIALGFSLFYYFYGNEIISALTSLSEIQSYASQFILWLVILPIISMPSFVYDGLFVATTEAKIMRNSMVMATFFCYIPLWYLLQKFGNHGLWLAFLSFFIIRSLVIHLYYKNWIKLWGKSLY